MVIDLETERQLRNRERGPAFVRAPDGEVVLIEQIPAPANCEEPDPDGVWREVA